MWLKAYAMSNSVSNRIHLTVARSSEELQGKIMGHVEKKKMRAEGAKAKQHFLDKSTCKD